MDVAEVFQKMVGGVEDAARPAAVDENLVADGADDPPFILQFGRKAVVLFGKFRVANLERDGRLATDRQRLVANAAGQIIGHFLNGGLFRRFWNLRPFDEIGLRHHQRRHSEQRQQRPSESHLVLLLVQFGLYVLAEVLEQNFLPFRVLFGRFVVVRIIIVFHAPVEPFAERMVRPVPSIFFKQFDDILYVLRRAWREADGGEFAHVDARVVLKLEVADGLQDFAKFFFIIIEIVEPAWITFQFQTAVQNLLHVLPADALMGETAWFVHVPLIDQILQRQRLKIVESGRAAPLIGGDDDRLLSINFTNRLRGLILAIQIVVVDFVDLDWLVVQIVADDDWFVFVMTRHHPP